MVLKFTDVYCQKRHHGYDREKCRRPDRLFKVKIEVSLTFIAGGDYKMEQPLWKTVCQFLTKLNMLLPCDPAVKLLDMYPKEWKT